MKIEKTKRQLFKNHGRSPLPSNQKHVLCSLIYNLLFTTLIREEHNLTSLFLLLLKEKRCKNLFLFLNFLIDDSCVSSKHRVGSRFMYLFNQFFILVNQKPANNHIYTHIHTYIYL